MFETENIMGTKVINLHELISSASSHNSDLNSRRLKIINDIPYVSEKIVELFPNKDAYAHYHLYGESYYILEGEMILYSNHFKTQVLILRSYHLFDLSIHL